MGLMAGISLIGIYVRGFNLPKDQMVVLAILTISTTLPDDVIEQYVYHFVTSFYDQNLHPGHVAIHVGYDFVRSVQGARSGGRPRILSPCSLLGSNPVSG